VKGSSSAQPWGRKELDLLRLEEGEQEGDEAGVGGGGWSSGS
jgi:hypothetical protein